jgi:hypothetical protein
VLESAGAAGLRFLFTSEPTLAPRSVGGSWVVGRFCPKATTRPPRIRELAGFRGWERAMLVRRLKGLARALLPGPYRYYVRRQAREIAFAQDGAAPPVSEGR